MGFWLAYLHLTMTHSEGQGQTFSTMNILQMMADEAIITIAPYIMSHVNFRLVYLELTLTYS